MSVSTIYHKLEGHVLTVFTFINFLRHSHGLYDSASAPFRFTTLRYITQRSAVQPVESARPSKVRASSRVHAGDITIAHQETHRSRIPDTDAREGRPHRNTNSCTYMRRHSRACKAGFNAYDGAGAFKTVWPVLRPV